MGIKSINGGIRLRVLLGSFVATNITITRYTVLLKNVINQSISWDVLYAFMSLSTPTDITDITINSDEVNAILKNKEQKAELMTVRL